MLHHKKNIIKISANLPIRGVEGGKCLNAIALAPLTRRRRLTNSDDSDKTRRSTSKSTIDREGNSIAVAATVAICLGLGLCMLAALEICMLKKQQLASLHKKWAGCSQAVGAEGLKASRKGRAFATWSKWRLLATLELGASFPSPPVARLDNGRWSTVGSVVVISWYVPIDILSQMRAAREVLGLAKWQISNENIYTEAVPSRTSPSPFIHQFGFTAARQRKRKISASIRDAEKFGMLLKVKIKSISSWNYVQLGNRVLSNRSGCRVLLPLCCAIIFKCNPLKWNRSYSTLA